MKHACTSRTCEKCQPPAPPAQDAKCAGKNCTVVVRSGRFVGEHSPECMAEHDAVVADAAAQDAKAEEGKCCVCLESRASILHGRCYRPDPCPCGGDRHHDFTPAPAPARVPDAKEEVVMHRFTKVYEEPGPWERCSIPYHDDKIPGYEHATFRRVMP